MEKCDKYYFQNDTEVRDVKFHKSNLYSRLCNPVLTSVSGPVSRIYLTDQRYWLSELIMNYLRYPPNKQGVYILQIDFSAIK